MQQHYTNHRSSLKTKYNRLKQKISRAIKSGRFYSYTQHKQQQLLDRLQRYYQRLLRQGQLIAPTTALLLVGTTIGQAQIFAEVTTTASPFINLDINPDAPFGLSDVGNNAKPILVDIDGDFDLDAFVGKSDGNISYFENTGDLTNPTFNFITGNTPFGLSDVGGNAAPSFADIDGDGDLDAFVGKEDGNISYFENTGDAMNPAFTLSSSSEPFGLTDVGGNAAPSFVDIDGDGDFDLFVGRNDGRTSYFENTGNATNPAFTTVGGNSPFGLNDVGFNANATPSFVDIDGDGDFDVFVGEFLGNINYFENTGDANSPNFVNRSTDGAFALSDLGNRSILNFVDIDGDGDFDAFTGNSNGKINYFKNAGNSSEAIFIQPTVDVGFLSAPSFSDIDGDGDFDVFIGEENGNVNYFENIGDATHPDFIPRSIDNAFGLSNVGGDAKPNIVDIDNDSDFDIFVGEDDDFVGDDVSNTNYFRNTGNATSPVFASPITMPFGILDIEDNSAPSFVDIDGDGDFDAFIGDFFGDIKYFENTGNATNPAFTARGNGLFGLNNIGFESTPSFADIDGDGDFDAFIGELFGNINYFENTGNATNPAFTLSTSSAPFGLSDVGRHSAPSFVDIDNDGDLDAFIGEQYGNIHFFKNNTLEQQPNMVVEAITNNESSSCQDATTTFATVNLDAFNSLCDSNGNATYMASVAPSGQGVSVTVLETGALDCEFIVEITTTAGAVPDEYSINLLITDPDGVSNTSSAISIDGLMGNAITLNLGTFKVLGDVDVSTISGGAVAAGFSNEFAVNILNTSAATTYRWTAHGTPLSLMTGDGDNTGMAVNIDVGDGNFIEVNAITVNVTDNVTQSILTINNPQDAAIQQFDVQLVATNPCGTDTGNRDGIIVLPVELLYFKATAQKESTLLTWETASEQNNDYFIIERSYNAKDFKTIGQVQGVGNSIEAQQYEFIDQTVDVSQTGLLPPSTSRF